LLLFSGNFDVTILSSSFCRIYQRSVENLVPGSNNLVESELQTTDIIVVSKSSDVVKIIYIVDLNFVIFALFEVILDVEALDPLRG
jgi:hypothetical protein